MQLSLSFWLSGCATVVCIVLQHAASAVPFSDGDDVLKVSIGTFGAPLKSDDSASAPFCATALTLESDAQYKQHSSLYSVMQAPYAKLGLATTSVVTVNQDHLLSGKYVAPETFLNATREMLEAAWNKFMSTGPGRTFQGGAETNNTLLLDIESPFHPRDWYTFDDAQLRRIVAAFKLRVSVVKANLPHCKVGFWGTAVHSKAGSINISGYQRAAEMGVFEHVDVLVPVLYMGSADSRPGQAGARARQILDISSQIHKPSWSASLTMIAATHFTYFGGPLSGKIVNPASLKAQLDVVSGWSGGTGNTQVSSFVLWNGHDNNTMLEFLQSTALFPPKGCKAADTTSADGNWQRKTDDELTSPRSGTAAVERVRFKVDKDSVAQKLLFFDNTLFANVSTELELVLNQPTRIGAVLTVTEEWESYGIVAYHTVIKVPDGDLFGPYRLYYDCGWLQPDHKDWRRFTALAYSKDGINWIKPNLGISDFNGSKANNIIWPLTWMDNTYTPGGFFIDTNPNATADARYKSVCWWNRGGAHPTPGRGPFPGGKNSLTGYAIYILKSPDGIRFEPMFEHGVLPWSDVNNILWYDEAIQKYVAYIRIDDGSNSPHLRSIDAALPKQKCSSDLQDGETRSVGRCILDDTTLGNWSLANCSSTYHPWTGAETVFTFDELDPPCMDIYTNNAIRYPSHPSLGIHSKARLLGGNDTILMFPSAYAHIIFDTNFPNDGLEDVRFVVGRGGSTGQMEYVPGPNGRSPFVNLGLNRCSQLTQARSPHMMWCRDSAELAKTDIQTGDVYMTNGFIPSPSGEWLYFYLGGTSETHGDDSGGPASKGVWGKNNGITLTRLRTDGFVHVQAPYIFNVPMERLPQFVTVPIDIPSSTSCEHGDVGLFANFETSVVGYIKVQVLLNGIPAQGHTWADSNFLSGNFIDQMVLWGNFSHADAPSAALLESWTLSRFMGKTVQLHVAMADAKLFSLDIRCVDRPIYVVCAAQFAKENASCASYPNASYSPIACQTQADCDALDATCGGVRPTCAQNVCRVNSGDRQGDMCGTY